MIDNAQLRKLEREKNNEKQRQELEEKIIKSYFVEKKRN